MSSIERKLRDLRHVVLDMDGTIYRGGQLFDTTLPFLRLLADHGIGYSFITNNCSRARSEYVAHLGGMGVVAAPEQILTSADATIAYLQRERADLR